MNFGDRLPILTMDQFRYVTELTGGLVRNMTIFRLEKLIRLNGPLVGISKIVTFLKHK